MSPRPRITSDLTILIAAGCITVLLCVASFFLAPVDSTAYEDGSSYSPRPRGAKAAFLMLKETGYQVERSFEPLAAIEAQPDTTVLILAHPTRQPSQQDQRALQAFLEAGGIVVATEGNSAAFLRGVPVHVGRSPLKAEEPRVAESAMVTPLTYGVPDVEMSGASTPLPPDSTYVPVYGGDLSPAIAMARIGEGLAVWWADSRPLTNASISRPGHAELLLNTVGAPRERVILWDEHYHGMSRSLWSYVAATPLALSGVHLGVLGAAALLTWSRRKWPVRPLHVEPRTSPLEFVESMGGLYQRAGVASSAIATIRGRVRRALLAATRLPPSTDEASLAAAVEHRCFVDAARVERVFRESNDAARVWDITAGEAAQIVSRLQQLAADIQTGRRPSRSSAL